MNLLKSAFAAVVVSAIALPASAAERRPNDPQTPAVEGPAAKESLPSKILSLEGAQAANVGSARVALVYNAFDERIERSKGVRSVRKPGGQTGLYCIRPTLTRSQTRNLVPAITVE
ncbi:MAG TPA: hypothetical protein VMP03_13740, partial [Methylomirabilota bacterium]|nr:hypothetical protein [Methylomirabilota bacterium]